MKRRDLLTAAPVAALTAALAAGDVAAATEAVLAETPVMRLFREWKRLSANETRVYEDEPTGNGDTPECAAATEAVKDIERRIIAAPTIGHRDFAMKVLAVTGEGQWSLPSAYSDPEFWAEARALVAEVAA